MQRFEAAFRRTRPQRRPGSRRQGDALEVPGPEVLQLEQIAEQFSRALGDDDRVRFGDRLQPRREVRRVADDTALLRLSRSQKIADDHDPGRDPDPYVQRRARRGAEFRRGLDDGEPGPHGALGVVFVRLRIAEIGEHAVAHVFGDEAALAFDAIRAATMIAADDLAHVLRIEPRRYRGRTDEVAEHHGQLAAFGGVGLRRGLEGWPILDRLDRDELPDRAQHFPAVAEDDAEFLQVLVGKPGSTEISMRFSAKRPA